MTVRAGLYGKLPARGDFITRGWPAATTEALDGWLSAGLAAMRIQAGEDGFIACATAAPLWRLRLPAGWAGPHALAGVLSPSVDAAGRLFALVAGWADGAPDEAALETAETLVRAAVGDRLDADALYAGLATVPVAASVGGAPHALFDAPTVDGPPVQQAHAHAGPSVLAALWCAASARAQVQVA